MNTCEVCKKVINVRNKKYCSHKCYATVKGIIGKNNTRFTGYEDISGSYWTEVKRRAEARGLAFEINIEDAWNLFIKQGKRCALSNWKIAFGKKSKSKQTASFDRIDSSKGYIDGNVQWVYSDINLSKWDFDECRYKELCWLVSNYETLELPDLEIIVYKRRSTFKGFGDISGKHWTSIKRRKKHGVNDITIEYAWDLYLSQNGRCALSGLPIYFDVPGNTKIVGNKQLNEGTASLDRINSELGYVVGNVQWVHKDINKIKLDFSSDDFKLICEAVTQKFEKPNLDCLKPSIFSLNPKTNIKKPISISGYKGVSQHEDKWTTCIDNLYKGIFDDPITAAKVYDFHALSIYGHGKCYLNFPNENYTNFILPVSSHKPKTNFDKPKSTSGYKGVKRQQGKWVVTICNSHIGRFNDPILAAKNYDFHALSIYGHGNCYLNFPKEVV